MSSSPVSPDLQPVVDEIADRVRRRMHAIRAGTQDPCTAVPAPSSPLPVVSKAPSSGSCATSCTECGNFDSCNTAGAVRSGVARLSPDAVRTSA